MRHLTASVVVGFAVTLFVLLTPQPAGACEKCHEFWGDETCVPAGPGDSGYTVCTTPEEASCCCTFSGSACTGSGGGSGGGGGGGWGGGGNQCQTSGFCPAECFSCGGSGGRPPI